jgi:hypothetical protein
MVESRLSDAKSPANDELPVFIQPCTTSAGGSNPTEHTNWRSWYTGGSFVMFALSVFVFELVRS